MKFQKTLLAASLAIASVAANAEFVANQNHTYTENGVDQGLSSLPVNTLNNYYAPTLSHDIRTGNNIAQTGETIYDDYGSGVVGVVGNSTTKQTSDVYTYNDANGNKVYQFETHRNGSSASEYFIRNANGDLVRYTGDVKALTNLQKGGQIDRTDTNGGTGFEVKRINNEGVKYGYLDSVVGNTEYAGTVTNPNGISEAVNVTTQSLAATNKKFVEMGIIHQLNHNDPSSNIYGVNARNGQNVTVLTGDGIALNKWSNESAQLLPDGTMLTRTAKPGTVVSATDKVRKYVSNGQNVYEVFGDNKESQFFTRDGNGNFVAFAGDTKAFIPGAASHTLTGTADTVTATYNITQERNVVTNKNVTYSEKEAVLNQTIANVGVTAANSGSGVPSETFNANITNAPEKITIEQSASAGKLTDDKGNVVKNADGSNKYGFEVIRKEDGKADQKTTITAGGISTTGTINAKDYQIDGVSIVDNIKTSVDGAVAGATKQIDEKVAQVDQKVAQVDEKIVEVDKRLTQFNSVAGELNGRVDQLNNRIDDVEKTAYRGVAIALAAQQAIPNLGAGQTAVFGGAGVYKSEGAGAIGVATVLADGRTSFSGALGIAGGNEVGGRLGVSYVFGGK